MKRGRAQQTIIKGFLGCLLPLYSIAVLAQSSENLQEILVTGGSENIRTLAGSAKFLDEEEIAKFDSSDVNGLLTSVPGVYLRLEDGYGLRPNIGIRGATADRSQKVTLMEDGVLITPAPYSAPAAYYLPNVNRMSAMEVSKGPASVRFGPHTVGGAINFVTPQIKDIEDRIQASVGTDGWHKVRGTWAQDSEQTGWALDALRFGADGFKELQGGGDTGFVRNDLNGKWQWKNADAAPTHGITVKLGYADEVSDETYLGLTDEDFQDQPNQRYAASQLDQFQSEHMQAHVMQRLVLSNQWRLNNTLYWNRYQRDWRKFDGFLPPELSSGEDPYLDRISAAGVFRLRHINPEYLAIIRAQQDSNGSLAQTLDITNNQRQYGSYGVESKLHFDWQQGASISHAMQWGVRLHHDYVERDHAVQGYIMESGKLRNDGQIYPNKSLNEASTNALAIYWADEIRSGKWVWSLGLRHESIDGEFQNTGEESENSNQSAWIPGLGVFYQVSDHLGLLAGVNRGFSPSSPSPSGGSSEPEYSTNIEYGIRYSRDQLEADAIGFFSDYSNLLGRCRVSDDGCFDSKEFDGGKVHIAGMEASIFQVWNLGGALSLPLSASYTYTDSAFQTQFDSDFSQWGKVQEGDALPYLPKHQLRIDLGLEGVNWRLNSAFKWVGEMREQPGQGDIENDEKLPSYGVVDVSVTYEGFDQWQLQWVLNNVTNRQEIVSRKPFGARPYAARMAMFNIAYTF